MVVAVDVVFPGVLEPDDSAAVAADDAVVIVEDGRGLAERPVGVVVVRGDRDGMESLEVGDGETRMRWINWSSSSSSFSSSFSSPQLDCVESLLLRSRYSPACLGSTTVVTVQAQGF